MMKSWLMKLFGLRVCFEFAEEGGGDGGAGHWADTIDWGGGDGFSLPDKVREYTTPADFVNAFQSAQTRLHDKGILIPGEKASDDERAAFQSTLREHLGINLPENADGYSYKPGDAFKDEFDPDGLRSVLSEFHQAGLTDEQVSLVMGQYESVLSGLQEMQQEAQAQARQDAEAALRADWGDEYGERMKGVENLQGRFGGVFEKLTTAGLANDVDVVRMMDEVARSVREDAPLGGGNAGVKEQIAELQMSDAFLNARHPDHKNVIDKLFELRKRV